MGTMTLEHQPLLGDVVDVLPHDSLYFVNSQTHCVPLLFDTSRRLGADTSRDRENIMCYCYLVFGDLLLQSSLFFWILLSPPNAVLSSGFVEGARLLRDTFRSVVVSAFSMPCTGSCYQTFHYSRNLSHLLERPLSGLQIHLLVGWGYICPNYVGVNMGLKYRLIPPL